MQYAIKDACDVFLLDRATRKPRLFSDYANSTNLAFTSDRTFARAKGVNKIAFDSNREGTFNIEFEVFDLAWISILLGATDEKETRGLIQREVLTVGAEKKVSLENEPKVGSLAIFTVDRDNRTHLEEQDATTDYTATAKDITFTTLDEGEKVVAYYMLDTEAPVRTFRIAADKFAGNFVVIGKTEIKNEFGELEFMDLEITNCMPQSNMEINFSTDGVTTVSAQFDLLADENNEMAIISIIE